MTTLVELNNNNNNIKTKTVKSVHVKKLYQWMFLLSIFHAWVGMVFGTLTPCHWAEMLLVESEESECERSLSNEIEFLKSYNLTKTFQWWDSVYSVLLYIISIKTLARLFNPFMCLGCINIRIIIRRYAKFVFRCKDGHTTNWICVSFILSRNSSIQYYFIECNMAPYFECGYTLQSCRE